MAMNRPRYKGMWESEREDHHETMKTCLPVLFKALERQSEVVREMRAALTQIQESGERMVLEIGAPKQGEAQPEMAEAPQ